MSTIIELSQLVLYFLLYQLVLYQGVMQGSLCPVIRSHGQQYHTLPADPWQRSPKLHAVPPTVGIFITNISSFCTKCRFVSIDVRPREERKRGWRLEERGKATCSSSTVWSVWHHKKLIRCSCGNEGACKTKHCRYRKASLSCTESCMCEANQQIHRSPKAVNINS